MTGWAGEAGEEGKGGREGKGRGLYVCIHVCSGGLGG